ncbi:MAG: cyclodeaminase/cyclohydrolase family protein [Candidatus Omnitrophota bacterium]
MKYAEQSMTEFLGNLSSQTPAPGGGSASALVGALGAALLGMVAHYTREKVSHTGLASEIKMILMESHRLRERLTRLIDEDIQNYLEVCRARRTAKILAKQLSRKRLVHRALRKALASSLSICKASHRGLLVSKRLFQIGNENLKSDAKAASYFFIASFQAALLMCEINAKWLKDRRLSKRTREILIPLRKDVQRRMKEFCKT